MIGVDLDTIASSGSVEATRSLLLESSFLCVVINCDLVMLLVEGTIEDATSLNRTTLTDAMLMIIFGHPKHHNQIITKVNI